MGCGDSESYILCNRRTHVLIPPNRCGFFQTHSQPAPRRTIVLLRCVASPVHSENHSEANLHKVDKGPSNEVGFKGRGSGTLQKILGCMEVATGERTCSSASQYTAFRMIVQRKGLETCSRYHVSVPVRMPGHSASSSTQRMPRAVKSISELHGARAIRLDVLLTRQPTAETKMAAHSLIVSYRNL